MKFKIFVILFILVGLFFPSKNILLAEYWPRTGIGLRGGFWDFVNETSGVSIYQSWKSTKVSVSGFGGALFLLSQMYDQLYFEFTLGAVTSVENHSTYGFHEDTGTITVVEMSLGSRYQLFPNELPSTLQPYISFGVGAYIINDAVVSTHSWYFSEEVIVKTSVKPGGYIGSGFLFLLSRNFGFNFDLRYQMVDFQRDDLQNGLELGIGFVVMWGGKQ